MAADGRRNAGTADRMRQRRQPYSGSRIRPSEGDRSPGGARGQSMDPFWTTADGEPGFMSGWWSPRRGSELGHLESLPGARAAIPGGAGRPGRAQSSGLDWRCIDNPDLGTDLRLRACVAGNQGQPRRRLEGRRRLARTLVVAEFALAFTLLAAAGMALHNLWKNTHMDLGVRTDNILTFVTPARPDRFKSPEENLIFYQEMFEKIRALPGVRQVAISNPPPVPVPTNETWDIKFSIPGRPSTNPSRPLYEARTRMISDGFMETFGARVVQGRAFSAQDHLKSEPVVMVNETFAREYLAGVDPLTQFLQIPGSPAKFRIIGVFRDIHNALEFGHPTAPEIYASFSQFPFSSPSLAVWTSSEPAQLRKSIAAVVHSMDPGL